MEGKGGFKTHPNVQKPSQHVLETGLCLECGNRKVTWVSHAAHSCGLGGQVLGLT